MANESPFIKILQDPQLPSSFLKFTKDYFTSLEKNELNEKIKDLIPTQKDLSNQLKLIVHIEEREIKKEIYYLKDELDFFKEATFVRSTILFSQAHIDIQKDVFNEITKLADQKAQDLFKLFKDNISDEKLEEFKKEFEDIKLEEFIKPELVEEFKSIQQEISLEPLYSWLQNKFNNQKDEFLASYKNLSATIIPQSELRKEIEDSKKVIEDVKSKFGSIIQVFEAHNNIHNELQNLEKNFSDIFDNADEWLKNKAYKEVYNVLTRSNIPINKTKEFIFSKLSSLPINKIEDEFDKIGESVDRIASFKNDFVQGAEGVLTIAQTGASVLRSIGLGGDIVNKVEEFAGAGFEALDIGKDILSGNYLGAINGLTGMIFGGGGLFGGGDGGMSQVKKMLEEQNKKLDQIIKTQEEILKSVRRIEEKLKHIENLLVQNFEKIYNELLNIEYGISIVIRLLQAEDKRKMRELDTELDELEKSFKAPEDERFADLKGRFEGRVKDHSLITKIDQFESFKNIEEGFDEFFEELYNEEKGNINFRETIYKPLLQFINPSPKELNQMLITCTRFTQIHEKLDSGDINDQDIKVNPELLSPLLDLFKITKYCETSIRLNEWLFFIRMDDKENSFLESILKISKQRKTVIKEEIDSNNAFILLLINTAILQQTILSGDIFLEKLLSQSNTKEVRDILRVENNSKIKHKQIHKNVVMFWLASKVNISNFKLKYRIFYNSKNKSNDVDLNNMIKLLRKDDKFIATLFDVALEEVKEVDSETQQEKITIKWMLNWKKINGIPDLESIELPSPDELDRNLITYDIKFYELLDLRSKILNTQTQNNIKTKILDSGVSSLLPALNYYSLTQ